MSETQSGARKRQTSIAEQSGASKRQGDSNASGARIKALKGVVVSAALNKTRTLKIERLVKHPAYHKYVKRTTKILFHDEDNKSHVGDEVLVRPCRPRSKRKSFNLQEIIKAAAQ